MIQKKICMVGAFAVGKTSLVQRFVTSIFSDRYLSTVGVKIDKRSLKVDDQAVNLILWDMAGEDESTRVRTSYLRGAAGYLLVVDGTRPYTLDTALDLQSRIEEALGKIPFLVLLNKADLEEEWRLPPERIRNLEDRGIALLHTSARTGRNVEAAFGEIARRLLLE